MNARTSLFSLLSGAAVVGFVVAQQPPAPTRPTFDPGVSVAPERPTAGAPNVNPAPASPPTSVVAPAPDAISPAPGAAAPVTPATPARSTSAPVIPAPNGGVFLNFQNASLNDVLTNLSETFGFAIVQEAPVSGTVNITSRQPLNAEEAVDLLNSVLVEKGYTAIRNGRILKIVNRRDAPKRDIPVGQGSDSEKIPRNDTVVTQILPLRFGEAGKLVENLRPLLQDGIPISANDASNAIIMTDTQTNIRRIAQIIKALDTSVSSISTLTVFGLKFADSKEVATIITTLFPAQQQPNQQQGRRGGGFGGFGGFPGLAVGAAGEGGSPSRTGHRQVRRAMPLPKFSPWRMSRATPSLSVHQRSSSRPSAK